MRARGILAEPGSVDGEMEGAFAPGAAVPPEQVGLLVSRAVVREPHLAEVGAERRVEPGPPGDLERQGAASALVAAAGQRQRSFRRPRRAVHDVDDPDERRRPVHHRRGAALHLDPGGQGQRAAQVGHSPVAQLLPAHDRHGGGHAAAVLGDPGGGDLDVLLVLGRRWGGARRLRKGASGNEHERAGDRAWSAGQDRSRQGAPSGRSSRGGSRPDEARRGSRLLPELVIEKGRARLPTYGRRFHFPARSGSSGINRYCSGTGCPSRRPRIFRMASSAAGRIPSDFAAWTRAGTAFSAAGPMLPRAFADHWRTFPSRSLRERIRAGTASLACGPMFSRAMAAPTRTESTGSPRVAARVGTAARPFSPKPQRAVTASVRSRTSSFLSISASCGTAGSPRRMRARLALPLTAGSGFWRSAMRPGTSASGGLPRQARGRPSTATTPTSINRRASMDTAQECNRYPGTSDRGRPADRLLVLKKASRASGGRPKKVWPAARPAAGPPRGRSSVRPGPRPGCGGRRR